MAETRYLFTVVPKTYLKAAQRTGVLATRTPEEGHTWHDASVEPRRYFSADPKLKPQSDKNVLVRVPDTVARFHAAKKIIPGETLHFTRRGIPLKHVEVRKQYKGRKEVIWERPTINAPTAKTDIKRSITPIQMQPYHAQGPEIQRATTAITAASKEGISKDVQLRAKIPFYKQTHKEITSSPRVPKGEKKLPKAFNPADVKKMRSGLPGREHVLKAQLDAGHSAEQSRNKAARTMYYGGDDTAPIADPFSHFTAQFDINPAEIERTPKRSSYKGAPTEEFPHEAGRIKKSKAQVPASVAEHSSLVSFDDVRNIINILHEKALNGRSNL